MGRYAGNQGTVVLNGVNYPTRSWEAHAAGETVRTTAGGDTYVSREPTFIDWDAQFEAELTKGAVPNPFALINTHVTFTGKITTGGTGLFSAGGNVKDVKLNVQVENQPVTYTVQLESDDPTTGPTITTASP